MKLQYQEKNNMYFVYLPTKIVQGFGWKKGQDFGVGIEKDGLKLKPIDAAALADYKRIVAKQKDEESKLPDFSYDEDRNRRYNQYGYEL